MILRASRILTLVTVALALVVAVPAGALAATGAAAEKPATTTAKKDTRSASERRADGSKFEREKLDQGAFAEADSKAKGEGEKSGGGGGSYLRTVVGLFVVLGMIYGVHYLLKKWGQSKLQGVAGKAGIIDVVATTPLAQGRALHLVRVGEELVLVGATEQSITRIGEVDASRIGATMAGGVSGEFQSMLSGAMLGNQPGVPQGMGGAGSSRDPFMKRFLDNLRLSTAR